MSVKDKVRKYYEEHRGYDHCVITVSKKLKAPYEATKKACQRLLKEGALSSFKRGWYRWAEEPTFKEALEEDEAEPTYHAVILMTDISMIDPMEIRGLVCPDFNGRASQGTRDNSGQERDKNEGTMREPDTPSLREEVSETFLGFKSYPLETWEKAGNKMRRYDDFKGRRVTFQWSPQTFEIAVRATDDPLLLPELGELHWWLNGKLGPRFETLRWKVTLVHVAYDYKNLNIETDKEGNIKKIWLQEIDNMVGQWYEKKGLKVWRRENQVLVTGTLQEAIDDLKNKATPGTVDLMRRIEKRYEEVMLALQQINKQYKKIIDLHDRMLVMASEMNEVVVKSGVKRL